MNEFLFKLDVLEKEIEQLKRIIDELINGCETTLDKSQEYKLNCQLSQELRKKFKKYRINNYYSIPRINLKNGFVLYNVYLLFLDNFEILIYSRDFTYKGYIYDIVL